MRHDQNNCNGEYEPSEITTENKKLCEDFDISPIKCKVCGHIDYIPNNDGFFNKLFDAIIDE